MRHTLGMFLSLDTCVVVEIGEDNPPGRPFSHYEYIQITVERRTLKAPVISEEKPQPERPGRIRVTVVKRPLSQVLRPKTSLTEVLHLKTQGPLARSAFYRYLKRKEAAKYIRFWVEVQDYVNTFEPLNPRSDYARDKIPLPERWNSYLEVMGHVQDALFEKYIERDPVSLPSSA